MISKSCSLVEFFRRWLSLDWLSESARPTNNIVARTTAEFPVLSVLQRHWLGCLAIRRWLLHAIEPSTSSITEVELAPAPAYRSTNPPASLAGNTHELKVYPTITKGMRTPFDLYRYYGRGRSSFGSPVLPMRFDQWLDFHKSKSRN